MKNPWENKFKTAIEASTTIQVSKGIDGQRVNRLKPAIIQLKKLNTVKTTAVISSPRYLDLQMTMKILKKHLEVTCFLWEKPALVKGILFQQFVETSWKRRNMPATPQIHKDSCKKWVVHSNSSPSEIFANKRHASKIDISLRQLTWFCAIFAWSSNEWLERRECSKLDETL